MRKQPVTRFPVGLPLFIPPATREFPFACRRKGAYP